MPDKRKAHIGDFRQKRRKTGSAVSGGKGLMDGLYKAVNDLFDSEANAKRNAYFVKPVSKTDYPDYYQLIERPICMQQIRRKINENKYRDVASFRDDMILLWDNARKYNQEDSWVYAQADIMQAAFEEMYQKETGGARVDTPSEPPMKLKLKLAGAGGKQRATPSKQPTPESSDESDDDY